MKLKGWVAKDKDDEIYFHINYKPRRNRLWWNQSGDCILLPQDSFPSLTWKDEPIEVEIEIKEVKK